MTYELLLEILSEEIPARLQGWAAAKLQNLIEDALTARNIYFDHARCYSTPRRLVVVVAGVAGSQQDQTEIKKGPPLHAPQEVVQAFMNQVGKKTIEELEIVEDPKKGPCYSASTFIAGRQTGDICAEFLPDLIRRFPWQKSMRWGQGSASLDSLRWIRPIHSLLCILSSETSKAEVIPVRLEGDIVATNATYGHFLCIRAPISVDSFATYEHVLRQHHVILSAQERFNFIKQQAAALAERAGLELTEDIGLIEEITGLVEWPVLHKGQFDKRFLHLPGEVIYAVIKHHQKSILLKESKTKNWSNSYIIIANILASDGGTRIIEGNNRVIQARLTDAEFFWEQDLAVPLKNRINHLGQIVFHEKLGSQAQRVTRLVALAEQMAPYVGASVSQIRRAAELCKADLTSLMVGEFPALQGIMGRYYALHQGEDKIVAEAIETHYKPQGPTDTLPDQPVSVGLAIADKLDILIGFWGIKELPTGSRDPYGLRRAALGIIRLVLATRCSLPLLTLIENHIMQYDDVWPEAKNSGWRHELAENILTFFIERFKQYLRDKNIPYSLLDSVFALHNQNNIILDDLLVISERLDAMQKFLQQTEGKDILFAYKRAANILKAEGKKDKRSYEGLPDKLLYIMEEEKQLGQQIEALEDRITFQEVSLHFSDSIAQLAPLREVIDRFFNSVTVNDSEPARRYNRLLLLQRFCHLTHRVADFSKIDVTAYA